jgi:hypothetical protein
MADLLFEMVVKTLLVFPGAFIRWLFRGFKGTYGQLLQDTDWTNNSIIGGAFIGTIIIIIVNWTP